MTGRPPVKDTNAITGLMGLGPIPGLAPVAAFNPEQIQNLLNTKGVKALHYRSALNPARESIEMGADLNTKAAHRGYVYYEVRELKAVPQHISLTNQLNIQGLFSSTSVGVLNVSGTYMDGDKGPVYLKQHDIIVFNDTITVQAEQLIEYDPNGPLQTKFKVKGVETLFTRDQKFREGIDYEIRGDGKIYWTGGRRPKFANGKGEILSLVYWISPHYVINTIPHSLRILPSNAFGDGSFPREAVYGPQQVVAVQSHLSEETNYLDFFALPDYVAPNSGPNTKGG